jgi:hypothetical protein
VNAINRRLRGAGVVALGIREVDKANLIHVHYTVASIDTVGDCRRIFEAALPSRDDLPCRLHVGRIKCQYSWAYYVCKAESRYVQDKWADKRLLFQPNIGIQKTVTVGDFWAKSHSQLWAEHVAETRRVHAGLELPGMNAVIKAARRLLDDCLPLKAIRWRLGYFAEEDTVVAWRERLNQEGQEPEPPLPKYLLYKSRHKPTQPQPPPARRFFSGDRVLCDWLPGIPCTLMGYNPHKNGWTVRFGPPGEAALGRIPAPIRGRLSTPTGVPEGSEFRLADVTEDDLQGLLPLPVASG